MELIKQAIADSLREELKKTKLQGGSDSREEGQTDVGDVEEKNKGGEELSPRYN